MSQRLSLATGQDGVSLPDQGRIAVFHPAAGADLSALPRDRVLVIQPNRPDHDAFARLGYDCCAALDPQAGEMSAAVVMVPRSRDLARALVAQALRISGGPVIVDGAKTDGIDSLLRAVRERAAVGGPIAKAHGKVFWLQGDHRDFADWVPPPVHMVDGYNTVPGVFSADGIDPASRLLGDALPAVPGRHVTDLGAGWGYLSSRLLGASGIERIDLVESDSRALACARANIDDPRAAFHWADARDWRPSDPPDAVVMNPPFHSSRKAEPALGQAFVAAAARMLAPGGTLWMVANRHLPYEAALRQGFAHSEEIAGNASYKIVRATRPTRARR